MGVSRRCLSFPCILACLVLACACAPGNTGDTATWSTGTPVDASTPQPSVQVQPSPSPSVPIGSVERLLVPVRETALVVRVLDGDSIEVEINDQRRQVRYLGVDAFEESGEELGSEAGDATRANRGLVERRIVDLERDVSDVDEDGRLLRYVYVGELFVNAELVRLGLAAAIPRAPDVRYQDILLAAQSEARAAALGLWASQTPVALGLAQPKLLSTAQATAEAVATEPPASTPAPSVEVTAWVSDVAPAQRTNVTVYGKISVGGEGIAGVPMRATWRYKTKDSACDGLTTLEGVAECTRNIGGATLGHPVTISVALTYGEQVYKAEAVFTPR